LCALRVIKKVPDLADHFVNKAKNLLTDRNHGVLLTAITLVTEMIQVNAGFLDEFRNVSYLGQSYQLDCLFKPIHLGRTSAGQKPQISRHDRI
jgi:hypothetical protein